MENFVNIRDVKSYFRFSVLISFFLSFQALANTPNHVYQAVDNLANNITEIRSHLNVENNARQPGVQIAKTPLHAYTKGLEVYEKVIRFKESRNISTKPLPILPNKNVLPADVLQLVKNISIELKQVSNQLGVKYTDSAPLPSGKTPSDVYENMWRTSYLMDGLTGAISPRYVYRNTLRIEKALDKIAEKMRVSVAVESPALPQNKKPLDANIEGFKVLYKLVALEKKLNMTPLRVSGFPAGNISPSDVYDTTNNILAELTRINVNMSLPSAPNATVELDSVTPSNVVQQFKKIQQKIDILIN